jgi:hypothetical protein
VQEKEKEIYNMKTSISFDILKIEEEIKMYEILYSFFQIYRF